jgi:DNA-directed RNA polymerase specialized sigma24 family protein
VSEQGGNERRQFHTTRWTLVASAAQGQGEEASAALETLCGAYWYPLYAFLRRRGSDASEAADLVQGFFAELIEKDYVAQADRERGRFRGFLLVSLQHFASKQRAKERAQKRGGGRLHVPLDFEDGERRYRLEPADGRTAEAVFERRWALTILERTMERLALQFTDAGPAQLERFDALKGCLGGEAPPYRDVGLRLGISETAVKVGVHRLRARYRDCLRQEIAETVRDPAEIDDEIRRLMQALTRSAGALPRS